MNSTVSQKQPPKAGTRPRKTPVSPRRRFKLLISYAPDWIITILVTGLFYLLNNVHGFWRRFSLSDTSIQYPYATHERVPPWALIVISIVAPAVIMPIVNVLTIRSWWDLHNSWLGLILSWGLTGTVTNIVKITAGRPRPDFIDRCQPMFGAQNAPLYGLVDSSVCTQTDLGILRDGFRSFFSGHSSLSFAGLGFLFWYGAGKMHLFDERGHAGKAWIALLPLMGAALVAISRTMDYRHHPIDVLIGSIVGLVISHFGYRQYYPSLAHPLGHRPYSPRIPREEDEESNHIMAAAEPKNGDLVMRPMTHSNSAGSTGVDDTVQRQDPDLRNVWRDGSRGERVADLPLPSDPHARV